MASTFGLNYFKTAVALALLPLCLGTGHTVVDLVRASGHADTVWVATLAGIACWLVVYLSLPEPMWAYVVGHELTHALWAWAMGGKVKKFKATSKGGHVVVTRSNFLVALAPYFFPIYAVAVVAVFMGGHWILGWKGYTPWFHLFLGAAYAFHVTLTWRVLRTHQSDIADQGYLFSAVVIWLGNVLLLVLAIPLLTGRVGLLTALSWCCIETGEVLRRLGAWL